MQNNIKLASDQANYNKNSFYIRSAYRFTPRLKVKTIKSLPNVENDENRPQFLIEADTRLTENYERLIGRFFGEVYDQDLMGSAWVKTNIEAMNQTLRQVLDIEISSLGNPVEDRGSISRTSSQSNKTFRLRAVFEAPLSNLNSRLREPSHRQCACTRNSRKQYSIRSSGSESHDVSRVRLTATRWPDFALSSAKVPDCCAFPCVKPRVGRLDY